MWEQVEVREILRCRNPRCRKEFAAVPRQRYCSLSCRTQYARIRRKKDPCASA